jgi:hypothetical protein
MPAWSWVGAALKGALLSAALALLPLPGAAGSEPKADQKVTIVALSNGVSIDVRGTGRHN